MNAIESISAEDQKWSQVAATGTVSGQNRGYGTRTQWRQPAPNLLIRAGLGGRCCLFSLSCKNRSEGLVPELSLGFCAIGLNYEQLPRHLRAIRSAFASHLFCPKGLANQEAWNDAKQFLLDQLREVLSKASWDVARLRRHDDQH